MKKLIILIVLILVVSCEEKSHIKQYVGFENYIENKTEVANYISELVKNANPKSDEEPEDNIKQAEETAYKIFGKKTIGVWCKVKHDSYYSLIFIPYKECNEIQKKMCDNFIKLGGK